jgi:hypothetical protein
MIKGKNTKVYCPEAERRKDRVRELKDERNRLLEDAFKIKNRVDEINKELSERAPEKLDITEHAIQRFQERIMILPISKIKKILTDPGLYEKYRKHGEGTYKLSEYPHIVAAVSNYRVITCYNAFDPKVRLRELEQYMEYYIERIVERIDCPWLRVKTFRQFRQTLYK